MKWKDYTYEITDGGVCITGYDGGEAEISVPSQIKGCPVTSIGEGCFSGCGAAEITLPNTVKIIGECVFELCVFLTKLNLNEGLEKIGSHAVRFTGLTELYIPSTVEFIGDLGEYGDLKITVSESNLKFSSDGYGVLELGQDFKILKIVNKNDNRKLYNIPLGTTEIGEGAFGGQPYLESLSLPDSVRSIGKNAFTDCFARISVSEGNPCFTADENALYGNDEKGRRLIKFFGSGDSFEIPENIYFTEENAFLKSKLKRIALPLNTVIGRNAFGECTEAETFIIKSGEEKIEIYVPRSPKYRKKDVCRLFCENRDGCVFDFIGYDSLASSWEPLPERLKMALCRLKSPFRLTEDKGEEYENLINCSLDFLLRSICENEDTDTLADLNVLGFLSGDNISRAIETAAQYGSPKILSRMMDIRGENRGEGFDFSL
ncbi:MAG: leucine-rich repeat domain-containing protein [Clostridiales bacterium]|nr:leucine-rich repeat domain-containing protein [Clostridiales bacterium]